jgi:DNA-binding winged helix-turn-helix (wHTH) protein/tetratricopeptide (TPR) repeat protein
MAQASSGISFGPYRLDPQGLKLWKGSERVSLQPRPVAVLSYLAERPGAVVGRDELLRSLWAGTYVTRAVLKVAVRAIREALEDDADAPRYIETVGREGYRFIAGGIPGAPGDQGTVAAPAMVGRTRELAALHRGLEVATTGARRIVFVSGEAGIGKTTLIDRFVEEVGAGVSVARGQCLEQYGKGEAYLPLLEAIGKLAADDATHTVAQVLRCHAPTWIPQLPGLAEPEASPVRMLGLSAAAPARMLREMADVLEMLTQRRTLVLVLEDLQWSDPSTVDLLGCIARRRRPARLMIVGSVRPADLIAHGHPLRAVQQELHGCGQSEQVVLELLSTADVTAYVEARFAAAPAAARQRLAARIHERTDGNPLFMVNMVNDLLARGLLAWGPEQWQTADAVDRATQRIPRGLQELIAQRLRGFSPAARRVLEAASVTGDEFSVAAVAAALDTPAEPLEEVCEELASQGALIADTGISEWPDGSVSGRYRFLHALYRRVLYEGIVEARRVRLHRAVGLRLEAAHGRASASSAAELAMHFTRGHDHGRALEYHELAGGAALDRHATHEAVAHFTAALDALAHAPPGRERDARELELVVAAATLRMAIRGFAAPEIERAFARAAALCDALPPSAKVYPVLRGLVSYHHVRGELATAQAIGERLLRYAAADPADRALRVQAHYGHGATLFHIGALASAATHLESALRDYAPEAHGTHMRVYGGYDPGVGSSLWLAWALGLMGRLDEALCRDREGLALARRLGDAFSLAWAVHGAGVSQQLFGNWAASEALSAEALRIAEEHGFPHVRGMAMVNRGWALVMQGHSTTGIPILREGVGAVDATGARLVRPSYFGMLAIADAIEGRHESAAERFDEALAELERTGEHLHEAAVLIGKSHLLAQRATGTPAARSAAAETCLHRALEVARSQGARLLELRAALALARHCRASRRDRETRALVKETHAWFADQSALTPEISAARRFLAEPA